MIFRSSDNNVANPEYELHFFRNNINTVPTNGAAQFPPVARLDNQPSTVEGPDWQVIQEKMDYRNLEDVQITYCGSFTAPATELFDASEAGFNCDEDNNLVQDGSTIQNGPFIIFQQPLPSPVDERSSDSGQKALYTVVLENEQTAKDDQLLSVDSGNNNNSSNSTSNSSSSSNSMTLALLSPASALSSEDVGYASAATTPTLDDSDEGKTAERQTCGETEGEEGQDLVYHLDDGTEVLLTTAGGLVASSEDIPDEAKLMAVEGKRGRRNRSVGAKSGQNEKVRYKKNVTPQQCCGAGAEITNCGSGSFLFIKDLKKM